MFVIVTILLFFSGAAGLIYEVIWTRILHYTFGGTEMAAATVLATFMGGMALGGAIGGKYASRLRRPILAYGILEAVIALFGILFTPLLYKLDVIYLLTGPDPASWLLTGLRFLTGVVIMLIPTVAMGATLPILVHGFVEKEHAGKGIGILYFINTFGAVFGTFLAGFGLIPKLGLDSSVYVAVVIGLLVAGLSAFLQFRYKPVPSEDSVSKSGEREIVRFQEDFSPRVRNLSYSFALTFAFVAGFISLSNEVLWFKLLGILLDGTIYGFSALLGSFLTGLALGSLWISTRLDKKKDLWGLYAKLQLFAAGGAILTILLIPIVPFLISGYISSGPKTPGIVFLVKIIMVFFAILVPTFFYGASFPVLAKLAGVQKKTSQAVGNVYSLNTLGCILGSALMGMVLLPIMQNINMLLLAMVFLNIMVAFSATFLSGGPVPDKAMNTKLKLFAAVGASLIFVMLLNPNVNVVRIVNSRYSIEDYSQSIGSRVKSLFGNAGESRKLVFEAEGAVTVVTVHQGSDGGYRLRNNGLNESYHAPNQPYYADEIFFLGALPYFIHPNAEKALLIGLGGGGTLDIMTQTGLKKVEVAELEPEVVTASRLMFGDRKHPVDLDRVKLRLDDGRNALLRHSRARPHTYDLVVSQPSHPWLSGAANLYTVEHFRIVRRNLRKNGMLCQWVNLFRMNETGFKSLMGAFTKAFDNGYVFQVDDNSVFLIGINGDYKISTEVIKKHLAEPKMVELAKHYDISLNRILKMYFYDFESAKIMARGARTNSDHTPVIETILPWVGHNIMFSVERFLNKKKLPYGLTPNVIDPREDVSALGSDFLKYLIGKIDLHGEDLGVVKGNRAFFEKVSKNWDKQLGSRIHDIQAAFYEKLHDFVTANVHKAKVQPSLEKTRHIALNYERQMDFVSSLTAHTILLLAQESWLESALTALYPLFGSPVKPWHFSAESYAQGYPLRIAIALDKVRAPDFMKHFMARMIARNPTLSTTSDVKRWEYAVRHELRKKSPDIQRCLHYVDAGGDNPKLVKELMIIFGGKKDRATIENLISAIQTYSSKDIEKFNTAKRLAELGINDQALMMLEYVRHSEEGGVEPKEALRELIKLKVKTKRYQGLGKNYVDFVKYGYSDADKKALTKMVKELSTQDRERLKNGDDPALPAMNQLNKKK
ncbi:fused MFS/spermidine synthase [Myxococcota bacterium]|nr:fused MFS/spermidine synthase [Myxococcota bacterium]